MRVPHFRIPLNLPHAGTVASRIAYWIREGVTETAAQDLPIRLMELLLPYKESEENPGRDEAKKVVEEAARLLREIVAEIERRGAGHDRLGQAVRNCFECLELGQEGALIALRAGESPDSALRPR